MMADIELVIKLSEESYKATCNGYMLPSDVENVVQGIKNGTLLPKGHGKLIDSNILKGHIDKLPALPDGNFAGNHSALKALINMQPTIIPAESEE